MESYSFGMTLMWTLFHNMEGFPSSDAVFELQHTGEILPKALEMLQRAKSLTDSEIQLLSQTFHSTFQEKPEARGNFEILADLTGKCAGVDPNAKIIPLGCNPGLPPSTKASPGLVIKDARFEVGPDITGYRMRLTSADREISCSTLCCRSTC